MKKLERTMLKLGKWFASFSLVVGVLSTAAVCRFILHQPEVPEQMEEMIAKRQRK